jgi:hypothetical protein
MSPKAGRGDAEVSANEYSYTHGAQINFGDLTLYLTSGSIEFGEGEEGGGTNVREVS